MRERKQDRLRQEANSGAIPVFQPVLPTDTRVTSEIGGFSFGMPSGWRELTQSELSDYQLKTLRRNLLVATSKLDGRKEWDAFITVDGSSPRGEELLRGRKAQPFSDEDFYRFAYDWRPKFVASFHKLRVVEGPSRYAMGEARALWWVTENLQPAWATGAYGKELLLRAARVWTLYRRSLLEIEFSGPADYYEEYIPALLSVLGTWRWLS